MAQSPPSARARHLAFVAHEIKNPLSTALWSADLLQRMEPVDRGGPRGEKVIEASLRALRRLRRLLEDHLSLERLREGALDLQPEAASLSALVAEALASLPQGAPPVATEVAPELLVRCDVGLVRRGLTGLLELLQRPDPAGVRPRLSLRAARAAGAIQLALRAGRPLASEEFDEQALAGDPAGSTLSLALTRLALEAAGGSLAVTPEALVLTFSDGGGRP